MIYYVYFFITITWPLITNIVYIVRSLLSCASWSSSSLVILYCDFLFISIIIFFSFSSFSFLLSRCQHHHHPSVSSLHSYFSFLISSLPQARGVIIFPTPVAFLDITLLSSSSSFPSFLLSFLRSFLHSFSALSFLPEVAAIKLSQTPVASLGITSPPLPSRYGLTSPSRRRNHRRGGMSWLEQLEEICITDRRQKQQNYLALKGDVNATKRYSRK